MAPIKFEDKLKDKLENRSLQPSNDAWNSLADRLDKEDEKNGNTKFWWLGIAATILGVLLVTTQFYKNEINTKDLPTVVETNSKIQNEDEIAIEHIISDLDEKEEGVEAINQIENVSIPNTTVNNTQQSIKKEKSVVKSNISQDAVASLNEAKSKLEEQVPVKVLTPEELKIIDVVAEIKKLNTDDSSVTNKEIDSLLKQAQREILKQKIYDETTKTVNADALLQDVEVELEQSFRDKVFEALKSGYGSVKTAVAERRN